MTELGSDSEEVKQRHRRFAVECNNLAWDIASQPERSASEEENMLFTLLTRQPSTGSMPDRQYNTPARMPPWLTLSAWPVRVKKRSIMPGAVWHFLRKIQPRIGISHLRIWRLPWQPLCSKTVLYTPGILPVQRNWGQP
jgi:hypothetical protein